MKISEIVLEKIDNILKNKPKPKFDWRDSLYEKIKYLSLDDKGDVGEEVTYDILKGKNCDVEYSRGVTELTKGWDIKSDGVKIEIKLATITVDTGSFQHENLHPQRDFDAVLFIDITPEELFLTAVKKKDIKWKELHRRENGVYKCDFTIKQIKENKIPKFKKYKTGLVETDKDFFEIYKHLACED